MKGPTTDERQSWNQGAGELSVFCQSFFKKTLSGQAGSIGGSTIQEVEAGQ